MKPLVFRKGSWHYKLASITRNLDIFGNDMDICSYTKAVFAGILVILIAALIIALAGHLFFHMVFGVITSIVMGQIILTESAVIGIIAICLALVIYGIDSLLTWSERRRFAPRKPDGFVKNAYKSWKDRYCFKVTFVDRNDNSRAGN